MSELDQFISPADQKRIVEAIHAAELGTSGEIKVHVEPRCKGKDPYKRAIEVFARLHLDRTRARNAVLIYVASADRRFSIIGDSGIHTVVGDDFWREGSVALSADFKKGDFAHGLIAAVTAIGARLAHAFPPEAKKENQLSDDISTPENLPPK